MKKRIAFLLVLVLLCSAFAGCKQEEYEITPDDKMTIAICALARSVKALKAADRIRPARYSVKSVRTLDGVKTMESNAYYDDEKLFAVTELRNFEEGAYVSSDIFYTYVAKLDDKYAIIMADDVTKNGLTEKTYEILYTSSQWQDVQTEWTMKNYGVDFAYQTYGRLEDLILSVALSQGAAVAKPTSIDDFTLTVSDDIKTESYVIENDLISQFVWTEMTAGGEDVHTWNYFWNVSDVTLPDLSDFTLVTE